MARPQSPDYDSRKQIILDHAASIFAEQGFHKASVSQITTACKISKSLIYHYYPSKQDILYHVLKSHVNDLNKLADEVLEKQLSPEDSLRMIIQNYMGIYKDSVAQHHLLITEIGSLGLSERKEIIQIQNKIVNVFADLADDLSPASLKGRKAKKAIAFLLLGMINWTYTWFKQDGAISPDELSEIIFRMLSGGLKNITSDAFSS